MFCLQPVFINLAFYWQNGVCNYPILKKWIISKALYNTKEICLWAIFKHTFVHITNFVCYASQISPNPRKMKRIMRWLNTVYCQTSFLSMQMKLVILFYAINVMLLLKEQKIEQTSASHQWAATQEMPFTLVFQKRQQCRGDHWKDDKEMSNLHTHIWFSQLLCSS